MLVWVDTETTGLEPTTDYLLEVGIVLTDEHLHELDSTVVVIRPDETDYDLDAIIENTNEYVRNMHYENGLWDDVKNSGIPLEHAENILQGFLRFHFPSDDEWGVLPMCGSTVSFDRSFLVPNMPTLAKFFGYRHIDVSTVKELVKLWFPETYDQYRTTAGEPAHRPYADITTSITELKLYRDHVFAGAQ